MLQSYELCDIWRIRNKNTKRYIYRQRTPFIQRRLDYIFVSSDLQDCIKTTDVIPSVNTDHSAVYLQIRVLNENRRGRSYWKFNNSLLSDNVYVEKMNKEIERCKKEDLKDLTDSRVKWDFLKYKIINFTIDYSKHSAFKRREAGIKLKAEVKVLSDLLSVTTDESIKSKYEEAKVKLESLYDYITEGIILRSRTTWYEKGEKSNKYFFSLEKQNKSKTHIRSLVTSKGETSDPVTILEELKTFYGQLYRSRSFKTEAQCYEYLKEINTPHLSSDEIDSCEGEFSMKECFEALTATHSNKSPCNDGLSKEFYLAFFQTLGSDLIQCLNYSFQEGEMSSSQKQAVITLIEKNL